MLQQKEDLKQKHIQRPCSSKNHHSVIQQKRQNRPFPMVSILISLYFSVFSCSKSFAEIEQFLDESHDTRIEPYSLKSLAVLDSLKNLDKKKYLPAPFVQELPNPKNVRTLFVATQALPIVDIQLTFHAGSAHDQDIEPGMFGLANMAAKLMREGTDQYSAKQLDHAFDALGAQFHVNAYRDMFIIRLRVLSDPKKLEPALDLMLHLIRHANFNASGLNLMLSNTKIGQKQVQENPSRLMNIKFYRSLYGQHPYAEPTVGTQASIKRITPERLKTFRDQLLVAQNSNLAITGDLTAQDATALADKITQNLPQGSRAPALSDALEHHDFNIHFIPHTSSQAYITMGHLGIRHTDPNRAALEVANRIFGGGSFNSLLSKELRVKRGYTYSASSHLTSTEAPGVFSLSYSTQQDQLMDSIQVAHKTLIHFIQQPLTQTQLEETKEGLLRAYPMSFSSNANINAQIGSIGFYGLPTDYLNQYQQQIAALTVKDIQNAIHQYLHADKLTIVVAAQSLDVNQLKHMLSQNLGTQNNDPMASAKKNHQLNVQ